MSTVRVFRVSALAGLVLLNLTVRVPLIPVEVSGDAAVIHQMAQSLIDSGKAKWVIHPTSFFGLYPYSYSSFLPYLLASTSLLTGLELTDVVWVTSFLVGLLAAASAYLFAEEFSGSGVVGLLASFAYSMNPVFIEYTRWSASTRALFIALLPMLLYLILRYEATRDKRFLVPLLAVAVVESLTHRLFFIVFPPLAAAFVSARLCQWRPVRVRFPSAVEANLGGLLAVVLLAALFFQFTPIYPFRELLRLHEKGMFFSGSSSLVVFLNMLVDYVAFTGPVVFVLSVFGFTYYLLTERCWCFPGLFIVLYTVFLTPLTVYTTYTPHITILLSALFFSVALERICGYVGRFRGYVYVAVAASLILSAMPLTLIFEMVYKPERFSVRNPSMSSTESRNNDLSMQYTQVFIKTLDGAFLTDSDRESRKILNYAPKPMFPFTTGGTEYLIHGYYTPQNFKTSLNPILDLYRRDVWHVRRIGPSRETQVDSLMKCGTLTGKCLLTAEELNVKYIYLGKYHRQLPIFSNLRQFDRIYSNDYEDIYLIRK